MRVRAVHLIVAAAAALASCGPSMPPREYTFHGDIAPVIRQRCAGCHRPGEVAPFPLLDYEDVRSRAGQIVEVTQSGLMPPWLPEPGYGSFVGERRLTPDEIERIAAWVAQGAPEGAATDLPAQPEAAGGWHLGQPDLVVELSEPYLLPAEGADVFRNFVMPIALPSGRWVRGLEVRPTSRRVVHHATILFDRTRASRRLDESDPEPGYEGMFSEGARNPDSFALGWTPGITPSLEPPERAWRLQRGSDLVVQLHLIPSGRPERVGLRVGFFFAAAPPTRASIDVKLGSKAIDIPAGEAAYAVEDRFVVPVDVEVLSVYPHAHYLAREMKAFATLPDGAVIWLLWIRNWDFKWQDQYRYVTPLFLPRGTALTMQYLYDNSAGNPRNPRQPPVRVAHGPQSSDEMADLWLRLLPRTPADAAALAAAYREHDLAGEIAGAELKAALEPASATWQNVLGIRYVEAGRVDEGIARMREAIRLMPGLAEAHNNLGHALQLQGRGDEALGHFRQAARLSPDHDRIHFNLAGALHDRGELADAVRHYRLGLAINPDAADGHNGLGVALATLGRMKEAVGHFRAALEIEPDYGDARKNLSLAAELEPPPTPAR